MLSVQTVAAIVLVLFGPVTLARIDDAPAAGTPTSPAAEKEAVEAPKAEQPAERPPAIEALTDRVRKSIATITSDGRDGGRQGLGSGFVISPDGLIATNFHVIGEGRNVHVQLADGRRFNATHVHAFERTLDLAILRIDAKDLPVLELGNSDDLKQGQTVVALGNPLGLRNSVVTGVVSGMREMENRQMIQLAIPIEPGNSGGPLVDLDGRVHGVMTMKSLLAPNLGFALTVNQLKPLIAKPNPVPMARWTTIGALDPKEWKPLFGARWRQRSGRISVDGAGSGFGGRSLCLSEAAVPERPFELAVAVKLNDEAGAAGLAFCSDGDQRHYGFYPTGGRLRLTRFDGPDVISWKILFDQASDHYLPGEWNALRVRVEDGKIVCFVNDQQIVEIIDAGLTVGKAGLVKFRETKAQFKKFRLGRELSPTTVPKEETDQIAKLIADLPAKGPLDRALVERLAGQWPHAPDVLRDRAAALEKQAEQLRNLANRTNEQRVIADLLRVLSAEEDKIDLARAGLLVARLDNDEVDVDSYCQELDRMGRELAEALPAEANDAARLEALRKYMFDENGFHGSRADYDNHSNSYLNEVLDDREGLPITLSVVYLELAKRIGLSVVGVGLPGHFVVRHVQSEGEGQLIDVFEGARPVDKAEAEKRIKAAIDAEVNPAVFNAMTKRAIVSRILSNLLNRSGNDPTAAHRYLNTLLAIDASSAQYHLLRAVIRMRLDERDPALEDVAWLLEHEPQGIDLDRVRQLQRAIEEGR